MVISFQSHEYKKGSFSLSREIPPLSLHIRVEAWYVSYHPGSPTKKSYTGYTGTCALVCRESVPATPAVIPFPCKNLCDIFVLPIQTGRYTP